MEFKRGRREAWVKAQPTGGVAIRFNWDTVVDALVKSGALRLHGETVERIRVDGKTGITLFLETESMTPSSSRQGHKI